MEKKTYILEKGVQLLVIFLSLFVIFGYLSIRARVDDFTRETNLKIEELSSQGIEVGVEIEEDVPVNLSVSLEDLFDAEKIIPSEVSYDTTVPINKNVRIKEDLSIPIDVPAIGRVVVDVPIDTEIQINEEFEFSGTVKIDTSLFEEIGSNIEINEVIPVQASLNINVFPEDEDLSMATKEAEDFINGLRKLFFLRSL